MGLCNRLQSSRWQKLGYGRGYNLVDGSNWVMEGDIILKMAVIG